MVRLGIDPMSFKNRRNPRSHLEDASDDSLIGPMPDHIRRRLAAQQQRQRVDQNGFTRAGLSRQQVQPQPEVSDRTVDHSIVFRAQFQQHVSLRR